MNIHGKDIKIFTGNAYPKAAEDIAKSLGLPMGKCTVGHFADGEVSVTLEESVRGSDVFLVQSTCNPVNDNLMELIIMIDACRRASAGGSPQLSPISAMHVRTEKPEQEIRSPQKLSQICSLPQAPTESSLWISMPHRFRASLIFLLITSWALLFLLLISSPSSITMRMNTLQFLLTTAA